MESMEEEKTRNFGSDTAEVLLIIGVESRKEPQQTEVPFELGFYITKKYPFLAVKQDIGGVLYGNFSNL